MSEQGRMLPVLEALPEPEQVSRPDTALSLTVVFTSGPATIAALKQAGALANRLGAHITLVVPQVIPCPLPLESSPVLMGFSEGRLREMAGCSPVHITVRVYHCRDPLAALKFMLEPGSLIVVGARRGWWPTGERSLARALRRSGHEVIVVEKE